MGVVRTVLVAILAAVSYHLRPFHFSPVQSAILGAVLGIILVGCEIRLQSVSVTRVIGAGLGLTVGILAALMIGHLLSLTSAERHSLSYIQVALLIFLAYLGLVIGAVKGQLINPAALGGLFAGDSATSRNHKILDTSVIIDGRICDICETGFVEGVLVIPQFVLRELQQVADSADSLKRNRGRRGLDILQRIQKMSSVQVQIVEDDFPKVRGVDMKLIELAKLTGAKIVTNDFNLNKVAQLQGVPVLNINDLANSLKPVVLPGETMRVFILKEGKEHNQGVAYLDDGTMVVVDNARKMISKTIDIGVTSVLQTTAGRMIFGRYDDRARTETLPIAQSS
ncbi:MAG: PIN domain nuclease [Acidobacteriota bacterium]|nr:PIN domain nuclease [Acidobacteriota bacterium]